MTAVDPSRRLGKKLRRPQVEVPIRWATVISVTQPSGTTPGSAVIRPSTASATDGSEDLTARYLTPVPPAVNSVVRIDVFRGDVLILGTPGLDGYPGVPVAMAAGTVPISLTAATTGSAAVSFPTGRFSQAPIVSLAFNNAGSSTPTAIRMAGAPSTSGFTCVLNATASVTATYSVGWIAVQMLTGNATG